MVKLIVGLGNPGWEYKDNRHNVGYMVVEMLLSRKLSKDIVVKKTNNFMNSSGEIVKKLVDQYKIDLSNLWVIHDDLDIPLGSYKIQKGVGPKLHNGIVSIDKELGDKDYWRVRIGVENRKVGRIRQAQGKQVGKVSKVPKGVDYVLQDFTKEEKEILNGIIEKVIKDLLKTVRECNVK